MNRLAHTGGDHTGKGYNLPEYMVIPLGLLSSLLDLICATHACPPGSTASSNRPRFAEWADNSVQILLRLYAKCIAGRDETNRRRIEEAFRDEIS